MAPVPWASMAYSALLLADTIGKVQVVVGLIISGLGAIAQLVFQLVVHLESTIAEHYLSGTFSFDLLALIGLRPFIAFTVYSVDPDWLQAVQHILPEPLVLVASVLFLVAWKRYGAFKSAKLHRISINGRDAEHDPEEQLDPYLRNAGPAFVQPAGYVNASLIILALGAACFSTLALPSIPYFALLIAIFGAVSMRYSGEKLIDRISAPLALYSLLHLLLFYIYQLPFVSARVSDHLRSLLGLQSLFNFPFDFTSWTHFAGSVIMLFSVIALFYFASFRIFARTVYDAFCLLEKSPAAAALRRVFPQHVNPPLELKDVVSAAQRPARRPSTLRWLLSFAAVHLWKVATVAAFCLCITFPCLLYLPVLVGVFMAFIGPSGREPERPPPSGDDQLDEYEWLEMKDKLSQQEAVFRRKFRTAVLRYMLFYALALLVAQYVFNLQSASPVAATTLTNNLGLTDKHTLNSNVLLAWLAVVCLLLAGWLHLRPPDEDRAAVEALHREMRQSGYVFSGPRPAPLVKDYAWVLMMLFFRSSYALALIGLYICSLLSVDVLSAGYLAFFLLFFLSETLAARFWWALILYTELVISLQFVWQASWTEEAENHITRLIGLYHFSSNWAGFVWSIVILLFTILQQNLTHNLDQGFILVPDKVVNVRRAMLLHNVAQLNWLPDWAGHIKNFFVDHIETLVLYCTYLALLLVAIMTRIGVMSITYLIFLFICLFFHLAMQNPRPYVRSLWPFVVFFSAIMLVIRYVYQFPGVGDEVQKRWPGSSYVTPSDFDLELYASDRLFVGLLGNTSVLVLAIITWNRFRATELAAKSGKEVGKQALQDNQQGAALTFIAFVRRLLILHANKMTSVVIFGACAASPSALNLVYLLFLLATVSLPRCSDHVGVALHLWTALVMLMQNLFRFSYWYDTDWTRWVGLIDDRPYNKVVGWNAALLVCLQIQRNAAHWGLCDFGDAPHQEIPLFPMKSLDELRAELKKDAEDPRKTAWIILRERTKWYLSNAYTNNGIAVFVIVLLISIFIRNNVLAVAYLPILGISLLMSDRNLKSAFLFLSIFFGAALVAQYVALFDFPPVLSTLNWPWVNLVNVHPTLGRYLALCCYNTWELFADFLLVFCAARLDFSGYAALEQLAKLNAALGEIPNKDGSSWFDKYRSKFFLFSYKLSLVLIFMLGTARPSFLTLGYVAISLFFLYRGDFLIKKRNSAWQWARLWNFGVLIFKAAFQAAFIPASESAGSWQMAFGLHKMTVTNAYADQGVLFDLAIFMIMAVQAKIFDHPSYVAILQEWELEQRIALRRSKTELLAFLEKQNQEKKAIEAKKVQRALRVQELLARASGTTPLPLRKATSLPVVSSPHEERLATEASKEQTEEEKKKSAWARFREFLDTAADWIEDHILRPDSTPPDAPRKGLFFASLQWLEFHSPELVFLAFVINITANADLLSALYPISLFAFAALEFPRPAKAYWQIMLAYCLLCLVTKFLFQIPLFCLCQCISYHVQPYCERNPSCSDCGAEDRFFQLPRMLGLYKYNGPFLPSILPDFLCLLCLLFHRHMLKVQGLWLTAAQAKRIKKEAVANKRLKKERKHQPLVAEETPDKEKEKRDDIEPISPTSSDVAAALPPDPPLPKAWYKWLFFWVIRYYKTHMERLSPRSDWYTPLVVCQGVQFLLTGALPQPFIGVRNANVAEFWTNSRIPLNYFLLLLVQFLLIILDRVIYLFKASLCKILLQYILIGGGMALYFWVWPHSIQTPFTHSPVLVISFLLFCLYLYLSALQIQSGYPYEVDEHYLTRTYSEPRPTVFNIYRAIPFAYELRTLLDWITTDTSLGWSEWLKIEDIYAELYNVKCRLEAFRANPERRVGSAQPRLAKFTSGVLLFVALCLIIWFPLLIVSAANPTNKANPVTQLSVDVSVSGWDPLFHVTEPMNVLSEPVDADKFSAIRNRFGTIEPDDRGNLQLVKVQNYSSLTWSISPPAFTSLIQFLTANKPVTMQATLTFLRQYPAGAPPLQFVSPSLITAQTATQLAQSLQGSQSSHPPTIFIPALFPRLLELPVSGSIGTSVSIGESITALISGLNMQPLSKHLRNAVVMGKSLTGQPAEYFLMTQNVSAKETLFTLLLWSAPQNSALAGAIASAGLIGLYVTFVLALGRFLRQSVTGLSHTIMFTELPECDKLIAVCEDLYLARKAGQLGLEELMYHELVDLYRSPERLKEETALPPGKKWGGVGLPPQEHIDDMRLELSKKNN